MERSALDAQEAALRVQKSPRFTNRPVLDLVTESHGRLWEWRALGEPGSPSEASCGSGPAFCETREKSANDCKYGALMVRVVAWQHFCTDLDAGSPRLRTTFGGCDPLSVEAL